MLSVIPGVCSTHRERICATIPIMTPRSKQQEDGSGNQCERGGFQLFRQRRAKELGHLFMPLFGFAFVRDFNGATLAFSAEAFGVDVWLGQDILSATMIALFFLGIVFARKLAPLWSHRPLVGAATMAMVISALGQGWGAALSPNVAALFVVLGAAGGAVSILLWAELESCLNTLRIVLYVSGAFLFGDALGWVLQDLEGFRRVLGVGALPLLSLGCLIASYRSIPNDERPPSDWGTLKFPWRLVLVLGVYEFVLGFNEAMAPADEGAAFLLGASAAAVLVFLTTFFLSHRFDFAQMFRTPFLFVACGLLATFLSMGSPGTFSMFLVALGYSLMFLLLTILLCDLSHRYGISVLVLCGVEELMAIFMIAGHRCALAMEDGALVGFVDESALRVALVVVVLLVSACTLFGERRWGLTFFGVGGLSAEADERGRFLAHCASMADAYRLSPRESEVFQLLALGKSPASIEHELCIANGTLKSHTRRIYQKLNVHSRDELRRLVGETPRG